MYISAYTHRQHLLQITERWLADRPAPDDAMEITRILAYDGFIAWHTLVAFIRALNHRLGHPSAHMLSLHRKKDLKDFITATNQSATPRAAALIAAYRGVPEFYYVGSPMAGYLFHDQANRVLSICRFKRVKRIAEKASRYAALYIDETLRRRVEALSGETGMPQRRDMALPAELQAQAEAEMIAAIRNKGLKLPRKAMELRDVVGAKVIDWGFGPSGLETAVSDLPRVKILDKEVHQGVYNATHYTIGLHIQPDVMITSFDASSKRNTCRGRGLSSGRSHEDFASFIRSGAPHLSLDLILTTYEELLESEIGRSMHETRIFGQRQQQRHGSNIPINIEYIIEYLLAVGLSPVKRIDEIPIKIWGRYLPDTLSYLIRKLYRIPEFTLIEG